MQQESMACMMRYLPVFYLLALLCLAASLQAADKRPNILLCISDDQSYADTGAAHNPMVKTPAFDRVAREGIHFFNAFCNAPTCGPSRSAILTGQPIWRLEEAGNIHSTLPAKFKTYTELLKGAGYAIGFTGKGWSPGRLEAGGRKTNPAGEEFSRRRLKPPFRSMANKDYAANFEDFLAQVDKDQPFCFWLGTHEPHRGFDKGAGKRTGKDPARVTVPPIFPDHPIVRNDLLDYFVEIEHFDTMVGRAIAALEKRGQLDNTIVVVTSDHGMPFPRAKASLYDAGTRVPLAIRWPGGIKNPGRGHGRIINLSTLAPTFLEAAGLEVPGEMKQDPGNFHVINSLAAAFSDLGRTETRLFTDFSAAFISMERHDGCRKGGKGYPCRAIRTHKYLYIRNYEPGRWPAGDPDRKVCARDIPFGEVDSSPTKKLLMDNKDKPGFKRLYDLAFAKRPAEELYDIRKDPGQLVNVALDPEYAEARRKLSARLQKHLARNGDPRALGRDAPWDYYPYYGRKVNKDWKVDPKPEKQP